MNAEDRERMETLGVDEELMQYEKKLQRRKDKGTWYKIILLGLLLGCLGVLSLTIYGV